MSTVLAPPTTEHHTAPTVRLCYDLLTVVPACGLTDLTDGKYLDVEKGGCPSLRKGLTPFSATCYLAAQQSQAEYLLDEAQCSPGTRLLDIGCGYGRILEHAARRRATAIGITISPPQVAHCRARGLAVYELNYRDIFLASGSSISSIPSMPSISSIPSPNAWQHAFDAIIANGSLEHFVQVADAAAGRADAIYEEMFAICRRLLTNGGRLVTTAIHFRQPGQFAPAEILRGPHAHPRGSPNYHYAMLVHRFGGWYPEPGQLAHCATDHFQLVHEEDGTRDYHLTSEYWLRRFRRALATSPRAWLAIARQVTRHPRAAAQMFRLQLLDQSWQWQFRNPPVVRGSPDPAPSSTEGLQPHLAAPMCLLRQTWLAK